MFIKPLVLSHHLSSCHCSFLPVRPVFQIYPSAEFLHKVSVRRSGVTKNEFVQTRLEQFGQCRIVAALGELLQVLVVEWPSPGQGSGVRVGIGHCTQTVYSSGCVILLGFGLGMSTLHFSWCNNLGIWREQIWSPFECFCRAARVCMHVWNRKEAAFLSLVRVTIPWAFERVHKGPGVLGSVSSVVCV